VLIVRRLLSFKRGKDECQVNGTTVVSNKDGINSMPVASGGANSMMAASYDNPHAQGGFTRGCAEKPAYVITAKSRIPVEVTTTDDDVITLKAAPKASTTDDDEMTFKVTPHDNRITFKVTPQIAEKQDIWEADLERKEIQGNGIERNASEVLDNDNGAHGADANLLLAISKDLQERKATKADDAPVPMSLWEEHLVEDGTRIWSAKERQNLPCACSALRKRM
jgi:hypothetical protein